MKIQAEESLRRRERGDHDVFLIGMPGYEMMLSDVGKERVRFVHHQQFNSREAATGLKRLHHANLNWQLRAIPWRGWLDDAVVDQVLLQTSRGLCAKQFQVNDHCAAPQLLCCRVQHGNGNLRLPCPAWRVQHHRLVAFRECRAKVIHRGDLVWA